MCLLPQQQVKCGRVAVHSCQSTSVFLFSWCVWATAIQSMAILAVQKAGMVRSFFAFISNFKWDAWHRSYARLWSIEVQLAATPGSCNSCFYHVYIRVCANEGSIKLQLRSSSLSPSAFPTASEMWPRSCLRSSCNVLNQVDFLAVHCWNKEILPSCAKGWPTESAVGLP